MSAVQRLCLNLAARLRLGSQQGRAALQTAARHLATRAGGEDDNENSSSSGSSSQEGEQPLEEEEQPMSGAAYLNAEQGGHAEGGESSAVDDEPDFDPAVEGAGGGPAYAVMSGEADGAFMMSDALRQLWEEVTSADQAKLLDEIERDLQERPPPGAAEQQEEDSPDQPPGPDDATPDDYRLLLEAIRLYFTAAPLEDEELDGMNTEDREVLAMIGGALEDELEGTPVRVVNTAPPGRLPWEILAVDEEAGTVHWGVDLTEGRALDPWRNARLSPEARRLMYQMHKEDPEDFTVERLAEMFRVRQQRVMAILALQRMEEEARAKGMKLQDELQELMDEEVHECIEAVGSGERHYTVLPSYPNYQELSTDEVVSRLEAKLRKPIDQVQEGDLTPELAREVLGVVDQDQIEEELAAKEEQQLVEQFRRNLEYNMGLVGQSLKRASRMAHAPRRPRGGWGLVVTPLNTSSDPVQQAKQSWVAQPNGSRRPLTEDELLYLKRAAALPRRKVL